jgi:hypothetical protein
MLDNITLAQGSFGSNLLTSAAAISPNSTLL